MKKSKNIVIPANEYLGWAVGWNCPGDGAVAILVKSKGKAEKQVIGRNRKSRETAWLHEAVSQLKSMAERYGKFATDSSSTLESRQVYSDFNDHLTFAADELTRRIKPGVKRASITRVNPK